MGQVELSNTSGGGQDDVSSISPDISQPEGGGFKRVVIKAINLKADLIFFLHIFQVVWWLEFSTILGGACFGMPEQGRCELIKKVENCGGTWMVFVGEKTGNLEEKQVAGKNKIQYQIPFPGAKGINIF
ncbi:hypothetical protein BY996DRAFT_6422978 [Phakopsora pachyrhizi]|nr:hypothetical protein BY996DRAFT_6422978 [Phakopsora pachyrhizi]